ncbi:MAG: hypothetical protein ACD_18C00267G0002 [uncultured bacterium]|nr:MAG: hypothetical protein ACD_18C00267G0002 [uncultured bacterium]OGH83567.1 MAG: hypothetical protein A2488_01970 [Candidatus Magasanikbacteria bacterium RIFOXYC12_FULL_32_21b]HAO52069.1 hypothetical protein [Candidatus Magasanikbacteria bacterium]
MQQDLAQFDFLKVFIEKTLDEAGFETLSEETRSEYVPQFVAEAERRLGLALIPKLSEESVKNLEKFLQQKDFSLEDLQQFWVDNIPDFQATVEQTLLDFKGELKDIVSTL